MSSNSPSAPWATAIILSPAFNFLLLKAGPPGITEAILVTSFSDCNTAPIPSNERDISWLKASALRGLK
ncbi:hypothetical protein D3C85_1138970 [compost metagenome]